MKIQFKPMYQTRRFTHVCEGDKHEYHHYSAIRDPIKESAGISFMAYIVLLGASWLLSYNMPVDIGISILFTVFLISIIAKLEIKK